MTLVQFKRKPFAASFNNLSDDYFPELSSLLQNNSGFERKQSASVNIEELEDMYFIEILAPGFSKDQFKIDLDNNILTVTGEKNHEFENKGQKFIRRDFTINSFKHAFTVDKNIDAENIAANYVNGILTLNLPKKAEVKQSVKQITIQ